ncbi:hypothetical protein CYMTET_14858, partial [Cymbomonas tetramitiformis]
MEECSANNLEAEVGEGIDVQVGNRSSLDREDRRTLWPRLLGVETKRIPNHYKALLELAGETPETAQQIEKDLPRTFSAREELQMGSVMWDSLKNVLTAFAAHDEDLGYVQSMNFLAAFLLLAGVEEEDAFWCLVVLVQDVVGGYFEDGMWAVKVDQRIFLELLHQNLPAVGLHVAALGPDNIICGVIASQWLLTLFVHALPDDVVLVLWDLLFRERSRRVLFAACLAVLEPHTKEVLGTTEMGECIELFQHMSNLTPDPEVFREAVERYLSSTISAQNIDELFEREEALMEWERSKSSRQSGIHLLAPLFLGLKTPVAELHGWITNAQGDDSNDGLMNELGELQRLESEASEVTSDEVSTSSSSHLSSSAMEAVSGLLLQADNLLRKVKLPMGTFQRAVRMSVLAPLHVGPNSALAEYRRNSEEAMASFRREMQMAMEQSHGWGKGMAWADGTLWSAWKGSAHEEVLLEAEELIEHLRLHVAELKQHLQPEWRRSRATSDSAGLSTSGGGSPLAATQQSSEPGNCEEPAESKPLTLADYGLEVPLDKEVRQMTEAHEAGLREVMSELTSAVEQMSDDAGEDLALILSGLRTARLQAASRLSALKEATVDWEKAAAHRREDERGEYEAGLAQHMTQLSTALSRHAQGAAAQPERSLNAEDGEGEPSPARPSGDAREGAAETKHAQGKEPHTDDPACDARSEAHNLGGATWTSLDTAVNVVSYEQEIQDVEKRSEILRAMESFTQKYLGRLDRAKEVAQLVAAHITRSKDEWQEHKVLITDGGKKVEDALRARSCREGREEATKACTAIEAAAGVALALSGEKLREHIAFARRAIESAIMNYIAAIDSTLRVHTDIVEQIRPQVEALWAAQSAGKAKSSPPAASGERKSSAFGIQMQMFRQKATERVNRLSDRVTAAVAP